MDGELAIVLSSIALACKQIASLVTRAGISNLTGLGGLSNSSVRSTLTSTFAGKAGICLSALRGLAQVSLSKYSTSSLALWWDPIQQSRAVHGVHCVAAGIRLWALSTPSSDCCTSRDGRTLDRRICRAAPSSATPQADNLACRTFISRNARQAA